MNITIRRSARQCNPAKILHALNERCHLQILVYHCGRSDNAAFPERVAWRVYVHAVLVGLAE